jgi:hypothetical protein
MREDDDLVIAPGGPRPKESVHAVAPGEAVQATAVGQHVIVAETHPEAGNGKADVPEGYVLAPGGYRRKELVHHVPDGTVIDGTDRRIRHLDAAGNVLADHGILELRRPDRPLQPGNVVHAAAAVPAFGSGWIAYGGWTDNTGFAITNFQTTWKVPPPPTTGSGQTIFLFNGIQNSTMIYQPVLQWGSSAAGGGAYWAVASWYADGQTGQSFHSSLVRVNPGDTLVGVMALTQSSTAGYSYGCQFTGIANTSLPIQNVEQLTWANETLEVYGITQPSDYPDAFETKMRGISLSTAGSSTSLSWDANNAVTDVGQHCVVVSNSSTNGEVDLCYSDHPVAKAQGLSVYNSQLYAVWKGMTADDSVWFSSSGNGSSWAAQQRIGGIGSRVGPSLAVFNGRLYAAWKGVGSDQNLYFSYFDGANWAPQALIGGVASRVGPALTNWNGKLYAAWRGMDSGQAIWYSAYDGSTWTAQRTIPGVASSVGPALAGYNGRLYAAWKGMNLDQAIWFASFDGSTWTPQNIIAGVASSTGPSLAAFNGQLYAAWKGMADDQGIYYASYNGTSWSAQALLPGVATSVGPALAVFNNRLYAMWKGMNDDQRLWFSSFDGHSWAAQATIPGYTGPDME